MYELGGDCTGFNLLTKKIDSLDGDTINDLTILLTI